MESCQQKELKHLSIPKNKLVSIGERKLALNKIKSELYRKTN